LSQTKDWKVNESKVVVQKFENFLKSQVDEKHKLLSSVSQSLDCVHLRSLHADPLLSGRLIHRIVRGKVTRICRSTAQPPPALHDIVLNGLQLLETHAEFEADETSCTLTPYPSARVFVNGRLVLHDAPVELRHNDRVAVGANDCFLVVFPEPSSTEVQAAKKLNVDWAVAQTELYSKQVESLVKLRDAKKGAGGDDADDDDSKSESKRVLQENLDAKRAAEKKRIEAEKAAGLATLEADVAEQHAKLQEKQDAQQGVTAELHANEIATLEADVEDAGDDEDDVKAAHAAVEAKRLEHKAALEQRTEQNAEAHSVIDEKAEARKTTVLRTAELGLEVLVDQLTDLAGKGTGDARADLLMQERSTHFTPHINEANAICLELKQPLRFTAVISDSKHNEFAAKVVHVENQVDATWQYDAFMQRLFKMRDMMHGKHKTGAVAWPRHNAENPFIVSQAGPSIFGYCSIYLIALSELFCIKGSFPIMDSRGDACGELAVQCFCAPYEFGETGAVPTVKGPTTLFGDAEDISEFEGSSFQFRLMIEKGTNFPERAATNVHFKYKWHGEDVDTVSRILKGPTSSPKFRHDRSIKIDVLTKEQIEFISKGGALEIELWGQPKPLEFQPAFSPAVSAAVCSGGISSFANAVEEKLSAF
jgi:hypothetical protein